MVLAEVLGQITDYALSRISPEKGRFASAGSPVSCWLLPLNAVRTRVTFYAGSHTCVFGNNFMKPNRIETEQLLVQAEPGACAVFLYSCSGEQLVPPGFNLPTFPASTGQGLNTDSSKCGDHECYFSEIAIR